MKNGLSPNRAIPAASLADDGRHPLKNEPLERESVLPFIMVLPEHKLASFVYTWVNRENVAGSAFVVFGPGVGAQPIATRVDEVTVRPGQDFDDWKVGDVHLRSDLKLKTSQTRVDSPRLGVDARFEAVHPAYAYGAHPSGCPDYAATNRLEQAGRLTGTLRLDGREIAFDTMGARDHSWGTRDWETPQHWKWLHAQAGPDCCVHFWQIQARGRTDLRGYVFRGGVMAEVDAVEIDFELDEHCGQKRIGATIHDTADRITKVDGDFFALVPFIPGPHTTLNEGAMSCRIEGRPGVGWVEFMWPTAYLELLRARRRSAGA